MGKSTAITKSDAALCQLDTAIRLFFADDDPVSVHTLAGSAATVFEDLCRHNDIEPFFEHIYRTLKSDSPKELRDLINEFKNFFKHADRDPLRLLQEFDDEANDHMLYIAVEDAHRLLGGLPVTAQVFQAWFCACYPEKLAPWVNKDFAALFPGIRKMNRADQKRLGLRKIEEVQDDPRLLNDNRTIIVQRFPT